MDIHSDVLKMAKTKEKQERIKWFYARRVFFDDESYSGGLALAMLCDHPDARFLVSLFPHGIPETQAEVAAVFLAHDDDARCLCWAAECGASGGAKLYLRSAEMGCAYGKTRSSKFEWQDVERGALLEKAAAQGDPAALVALARLLQFFPELPECRVRSHLLFREAASLGAADAQWEVGKNLCARDSVEQYVWLRRAALQCVTVALRVLKSTAEFHWTKYREGNSGRIVYEIGMGLASIESWELTAPTSGGVEAGRQCIAMYRKWCEEAKTGVLCWIWLARKEGVAKDIRLLIADLIWEDRAAWSERVVAK